MISIDPGNEAGVAVFDDGVLVRAELVVEAVARKWKWEGPFGHFVVCEFPQVYSRSKVKSSSLAPLMRTANYMVRQMRPDYAQFVLPREWKGQRPKEVDNQLTLRLLSDQERRILDGVDVPAAKRHNVIDAIGIGLWALKRR